MKKRNDLFGLSTLPEYKVWQGMLGRCGYASEKARHPDYFGRGIQVCERWQKSYLFFLEDMGFRPSKQHSIDRKNNDGHYEPDNCRWATWSEQSRNKRTTAMIEIGGFSMPLHEAATFYRIPTYVIRQRLIKGWSPEEALTTPSVPNPRCAPEDRPGGTTVDSCIKAAREAILYGRKIF